MTFLNTKPPQINLSRRRFEPPLFVDMEAFFEFSFWMAEELLDLEAKHKLQAVKNASNDTTIPESVLNRWDSVVE